MTRWADLDGMLDCYYRVLEFRRWLDRNQLFPQVPDDIVRPMREQLISAEGRLIVILSDLGRLSDVVAIQEIVNNGKYHTIRNDNKAV